MTKVSFFVNPDKQANVARIKFMRQKNCYFYTNPLTKVIAFPQHTGKPTLIMNMRMGDIIDVNNILYVNVYSRKVYLTNSTQTTTTEVGDYSSVIGSDERIEQAAASSDAVALLAPGRILYKKFTDANWTTLIIDNSKIYSRYHSPRLVATNDGYFYICYRLEESTYIYNVLTQTNIKAFDHYSFTSKKVGTSGNVLLLAGFTGSLASVGDTASLLTFEQGVLTHSYDLTISESSLPELFFTNGGGLYDVDFTQYIYPDNTIHDMAVFFYHDSTNAYTCKYIDLTASTEDIDTSIVTDHCVIANTNISFDYDYALNTFATSGPYNYSVVTITDSSSGGEPN